MATRVIIIDDEYFAREAVKVYLAKYPGIEIVEECATGLQAIEAISKNLPDLIFLDIQIPELNGFEVLSQLKAETLPIVIFTTAYDNFALQAFDANATDYLLKPFEQERFDVAMEKAQRLLDRKQKLPSQLVQKLSESYDKSLRAENKKFLEKVLIKTNQLFYFVYIDDICWFEGTGDFVTVHTESKSHLLNSHLTWLEERLNPEQFVRIHRSSIVNVKCIHHFEPHFNGEYIIKLNNNDTLKLTRTYRHNLKILFGEEF